MVVLKVDIDCVLAVERESQTQIAGNIDSPTIPPITAQWMETPSGHGHVLRPRGGIQPVKHALDARAPGNGDTFR